MSTKKGILVVLSGFSGAGKGTIVKKLMAEHGEDYALSISATTRLPREGEQDGVHYFFVTKERFEEMIRRKELIEHACYVGNYYGTPKAYVTEQLEAGKSVILEIEMQGALQIRELFPDTRLLFVTTPSADVLKERLVGRGTETPDVIEDRLSHANVEMEYMPKYDYLVVNDDLDQAVANVHKIISCECSGDIAPAADMLVSANTDFIQQIRQELKSFLKGDK